MVGIMRRAKAETTIRPCPRAVLGDVLFIAASESDRLRVAQLRPAVALATFLSPTEADLVAALLPSANIPATLENEHSSEWTGFV